MKNRFILLFALALLLYIGLNAYVIFRVGGLLGIAKGVLYLATAVSAFALPVALYLERSFPTRISRGFYIVSSLWMGFFLLLLSLLLVYEAISPFFAVPHAGIILVATASLLTLFAMINARGFVVKEVAVPISKLKKDITVVHLSDIHLGSIRNTKFLQKIVEKTHQLAPDIVMITGDMVDARARISKELFRTFDRLSVPIYFVSGNHEVYEQKDLVYEFMKDSKITILKNEVVDYEGIQVVGLEYSHEKGYLKGQLEQLQLDAAKPAVLMYHTPEGMIEAQKAGIDVQLAGHTHYGQIMPFNLLVALQFKQSKGLYNLGGLYLHVSPGTGTWGPYMRLGSRNEITVLKLNRVS